MNFTILGAGGIGGLIGARLARAGEDVTLIARGPHLEAMREHGLRIREDGVEFTVRTRCTDSLDPIRESEVVFVTLKAHSLPALAGEISRRLASGQTLVSAQNGVPWWYFQQFQGEVPHLHLESVDPDGILARSIDPALIVACVVYPATRVLQPGLIEHVEGNRLSLGELDGAPSQRCTALSDALTRAGFKAPVQPDIRSELWLKLLGNATFNPLSALTGATLAQIVADDQSRELVRAAMEEVAAVATRLGARLPISIDRRIRAAGEVGQHRTSMLQDLEAGRPLEIEATVGAVVDLAQQLEVPAPHLATLYSATRLLDATRRPVLHTN